MMTYNGWSDRVDRRRMAVLHILETPSSWPGLVESRATILPVIQLAPVIVSKAGITVENRAKAPWDIAAEECTGGVKEKVSAMFDALEREVNAWHLLGDPVVAAVAEPQLA